MDPSKPIHIIINLKNKFNSEAVENFKCTYFSKTEIIFETKMSEKICSDEKPPKNSQNIPSFWPQVS